MRGAINPFQRRNGAKEAALEAFIDGRIGFLQMAEVVEEAVQALAPHAEPANLEDVIAADAAGRSSSLDAA